MKKSRIFISLTSILLLLLLGGFQLTIRYQPVMKNVGLVYEVKAGTSTKLFINQLANQNIIQSRWPFYLYTLFTPFAQIKSGEYYFPANASFANIWQQVTKGTGLYYRSFTIIPGWNFKQLKQALLQAPGLKPKLIHLSNEKLMQTLGATQVNPEGMFLPDTYFYTKGETDHSILKTAYDHLQTQLDKAWGQRENLLPYQSAYDALIAASLIEKEAKYVSELPMIAGVLVNRLEKNMLLQFDPTVIYGMGDQYKGNITKHDLTTATPYNTYMKKGLPPTPIAMPSTKAIQASLQPAYHDFIYFVAVGNGEHVFSKTLSEHNKAVANLLKLQRKANPEKAIKLTLHTNAKHASNKIVKPKAKTKATTKIKTKLRKHHAATR